MPPPVACFRPEEFFSEREIGRTTRGHSYAWIRDLAVNPLGGKHDGYKGMLNLCTYINILFDNEYKILIKIDFNSLS